VQHRTKYKISKNEHIKYFVGFTTNTVILNSLLYFLIKEANQKKNQNWVHCDRHLKDGAPDYVW